MRYEEDPSNVFGARYWAESQADEFHAMQLLKATGPVHEIVAYIDAVPAPRMTGSVPAAVTQAAAALSELDSQQRLHASANARDLWSAR